MLRHRRALAVAVSAVVLGGAAAAPQALADTVPPPSLMGETLVAGVNSTVGEGVFDALVTCNADRSGTFTFSASGDAFGPYPGTFVETGTVKVGPSLGVVPGPVVTFHADFTITSGATIVSGSKDLVASAADNGACYSDPFSYEATFDTLVSYTATIDTGGPVSYRDTGTGTAQGDAANTFGFLAAIAAPEGPFSSFTETFDLSNGVVPLGSTGHVTGGGWILGTTMLDRVSFGFEVKANPNGLHATCTVIDHATQTKVHCTDATSLLVTGTHATFSGHATVDGVATTYRIDVDDLGEPGTSDTFTITTGSGYAAGGRLMGGNIQIHKS